MLRVYSLSLGCPKNRVDTEHALGALRFASPFLLALEPEEADCVFINTCGFIAPAVEESVRSLMELIARIQALPPEKRPLLAVAGCLVGRYGKESLAPDLPEVDLFLDNRELAHWGCLLEAALKRKRRHTPLARKKTALQFRGDTALHAQNCPAERLCPSPAEADSVCLPARFGNLPRPRLLSTGPSYAWLKISDGCRHRCSFCTIPAIRGPLRSSSADLLTAEAGQLLEQGVKELVLVAQDLTAWGRDLGLKHGLLTLLEKLLPLPGLARLRLMYLYPTGLTRELLAFLQSAGAPFVPYFDVPAQHAAPAVLARMGRPFAGKPRAAFERIRSFFPEAALRTSIITGFPGESEADFDELRRFVAEMRFAHLGVFAYQAEEGTKAASMPGQVSEKVKSARREEIMAMQREISEELLRSYEGQRLKVLVDRPQGEWPGLYLGRAWFQAPESDGIVYVSGPGVIPGALVEADIVETSSYDLVGLTDAEA